MALINFTPHYINIADRNGNVTLRIPPSGKSIRIEESFKILYQVGPIEIRRYILGKAFLRDNYSKENIGEIPDVKEDIYLIVSSKIQAAFPERKDMLVPDMHDCFREEGGRVVAVRALTF